MNKLFYTLILWLVFMPQFLMAQQHSAEALYEKGDYEQAAEAYLELAKTEGTSAGLYFDLANCYAHTGNLGSAILYYSRASRMNPSNDKIKNNLDYFSSKVEDSNRAELRGSKVSVAPDPETFFTSAHRVIAKDVSSNTWAIWALCTFLMLLGCIILYLFCNNILLRKTGFFGGFILLLLTVMFVMFSFMSAKAYSSHDQAVLMAYKTQLVVEPSSDAKPAANQLCQGTVFDILSEESGIDGTPTWYKVRLNSNIEGWIKANLVEII